MASKLICKSRRPFLFLSFLSFSTQTWRCDPVHAVVCSVWACRTSQGKGLDTRRQKKKKKVAIPIVPTIRVLITFTKFEELQPVDEFSTPLSSPAHFLDSKVKDSDGSTSWISWMRGSRGGQSSDSEGRSFKDEIDPFHIPSDYTWVDANEKKRRMKAKKARSKKGKKQSAAKSTDAGHRVTEDMEEQ